MDLGPGPSTWTSLDLDLRLGPRTWTYIGPGPRTWTKDRHLLVIFLKKHEDPGPPGPDPRSQVPGPGPRSRVLGPGPRSKVSGPIGPAPKGPGPDPKSWSSVQLLYIGPGPRCGSQLQGAGPGYRPKSTFSVCFKKSKKKSQTHCNSTVTYKNKFGRKVHRHSTVTAQ